MQPMSWSELQVAQNLSLCYDEETEQTKKEGIFLHYQEINSVEITSQGFTMAFILSKNRFQLSMTSACRLVIDRPIA